LCYPSALSAGCPSPTPAIPAALCCSAFFDGPVRDSGAPMLYYIQLTCRIL
jgi:hypothetical protein